MKIINLMVLAGLFLALFATTSAVKAKQIAIVIDDIGYHQRDLEFLSLPGKRSEERRVGKECRSRWSPYH